MKLILALDELLAFAVRREMFAEHEWLMKGVELVRASDPAAIKLSRKSRGVIAIGSFSWDPLPALREMQIPKTCQAVVVAADPLLNFKQADMAGVFSLVPATISNTAATVAVECALALSHLQGRSKKDCPRLVCVAPDQSPVRRRKAPVFKLHAQRKAAGPAAKAVRQ